MKEFKDLGARVEGEGEKPREIMPTVRDCYRHALRQLGKYFAKFLLIWVVFIIVLFLSIIISNIISIIIPGIINIIDEIYGILILIGGPLQVGFYFVCLKISRGEELKVKDLFCAFKNFKNYGTVLLSLLLMTLIVLVGFIFIIPGIYFACKLAFVPYLVVDRGMGAIAAIRTSWHMTTGYAMTVLLLIWLLALSGALTVALPGTLSFWGALAEALPGALFGGICVIVGVIPVGAMWAWAGIAYATLYYVSL